MNFNDALTHFGSLSAMSAALDLPDSTVSDWRKKGIPPLRQLQIEQVTKRKLRADDDVFAPNRRKKREA